MQPRNRLNGVKDLLQFRFFEINPVRIGNSGFGQRIEGRGQGLRLTGYDYSPSNEALFLHRPRQLDYSFPGLTLKSLKAIDNQRAAVNTRILDQFRDAMTEIERMSKFGLTRFGELFCAQPNRPLEDASRGNKLRYHCRLSASRFAHNDDHAVSFGFACQPSSVILSGELDTATQDTTDTACIFRTGCFEPFPIGPEIGVVYEIKTRA